MRWLPEHDDEAPKPDDLPPREQRLLLMRLASLFGPDAIAQSPRATRFATEGEVRVVVGLRAAHARRGRDRAPARRGAHAGRGRELRRGHRDGQSERRPGNGRAADSRHRCGGWRTAATPGAGSPRRRRRRRRKLGEILAIKEGDTWALGGRAPDAAAPGRRDDRRRRDHRPAAGARADAQLGRRRRTPAAPAPSGRSSASICRRIRTTGRWRSAA